jgi:WD40 repeat protein
VNPAASRSPYRGLIPYQEEDAGYFFGRSADTGVIIANLLASRLTLLYGASGVGKSSVLNAGVLPALRKLAASNRAETGRPELALVVFREWAHAPALGLARAVREACAPEGGADTVPPGGLLAALREGADRVGGEVLVILDQFEEHFQYAAPGDDAESFDDALVAALVDRGLRANFLFAIREDSLAKLDQFKGRIPNLFDNYLRIEHLKEAAAKEAIEKPVARFNELYREGQAPVRLGEGLVDKVLGEVQAGRVAISDAALGGVDSAPSGEMRVETPFLQLVMTRLWDEEVGKGSDELRLHTFSEGLGGARSIVQNHVTSALNALSAAEKALAVAAFRFLITPSRTKIALPAADLAALSEQPIGPLSELLEKLTRSDFRILKPVAPPPGSAVAGGYEIWHDVLAQALLDWRTERVREADVEAMRVRADTEVREAQRRTADREAAVRRSRWTTAIVSVCLVVSLLFWWDSTRQRERAHMQQAVAQTEARRAELRKLIADARIALATDPELGLLLAGQGLRQALATASEAAAEAADAASLALAGSRMRARISTGKGSMDVARIALTPDGATLVSLDGDDRVAWTDVTAGTVAARSAGVTGPIIDMAVDGSGSRVVLALNGGSLHLVDREGHAAVELAKATADVSAVAWSPKRDLVAAAGGDGVLALWDTNTRTVVASIAAFRRNSGDRVRSLEFSPDGRWLLGAGAGRDLLVWSVESPGGKPFRFCWHRDEVLAVSWAPDGKRFASAGMDRSAAIWAFDERARREDCNRAPLRRFVGHVNTVFDVRFSPDGSTLATASADTTVRLWDVETGELLLNLLGHVAPVERAVFLRGGEQLASASWDGTTRVWDVTGYASVHSSSDMPNGGERALVLGQDGHAVLWDSVAGQVVKRLSFPDAERLALGRTGEVATIGYTDGRIEVRSLQDGRLLKSRPANGKLAALDISDDAKSVAWADEYGQTHLWRWESGPVRELPPSRYFMNSVHFSPNGRWLVAGDQGGQATLWDIESDRRVPLEGHSRQFSSVAWSRDGRWLATAGFDKTARVWELPGGGLRHTMPLPDLAFDVAFSPDDATLLAVAGKAARLFDVQSGAELRDPLEGHENFITAGKYSPDGKRIATVGWDRTARVWDSATGKLLATYTHDHALSGVAFSPDGQALTTVGETAEMRYIPLDHAALLAMAEKRATRALTAPECLRYLNLVRCPAR